MRSKVGKSTRDLDCIGGKGVKLTDLSASITEIWEETLSDGETRRAAERASGVSLAGLSAPICGYEARQAREGYALVDAFIISVVAGITVAGADKVLRELWNSWLLPKLTGRVAVQRLMRS